MEAVDRTGVLLLNVGTPSEPTTQSVRRYLREFLGDPRVLDLPAPLRWMLLNFIILPTRPAKSAAAYRKVWRPDGSPLRVFCESLRSRLQDSLGSGFQVELAMRYGQPSIHSALEKLRRAGCARLAVLPLYPQYASSSTGTSLEAVYRELAQSWNVPSVRVLPPFHGEPAFLDAAAAVAKPVLDAARVEYLLVSFHGLPERHILRSDPSGVHCLKSETCCDAPVPENRFCYRFQSHETARQLTARLGFGPERHGVSFQSRLGTTPWLRPFTDLVVPALAKRGIRRLGIICPSFVADCLETLEEIGIRAREAFVAVGGEELTLVPCLNDDPRWVAYLAEWTRSADPELRSTMPILKQPA